MVDSPFVGLSPFDARHHEYFFGRRSDATIIAAKILSSRICVVFGRSGVGKTSVMQAAVPWALNEFEPTTFLCLRTWQEDPYGDLVAALRTAADEYGVSIGDSSDIGPSAMSIKIAKQSHLSSFSISSRNISKAPISIRAGISRPSFRRLCRRSTVMCT